jgi:hypothetical protein
VSKFLSNNILTGRQKTLLHFQREYLVGSDSNATSSCDDHRLQRNDFQNENLLCRVFATGKFNRYLKEYLGQGVLLNKLDHRLLKGFYVSNRKEIDIDYKGALKSDDDNKQLP